MRLPKKIQWLGVIWEFNGSHLKDKLPQILRNLRRYPRMVVDTAVILACYRVSPDQGAASAIDWEAWKTSRKNK